GLNHPKMQTPEFREKLAAVALNKPTCSDVMTVEMAEFVETFSRLGMPEELPHLFLIEGGALGVENALKAAFDWKIRKNFRKEFFVELRAIADEHDIMLIFDEVQTGVGLTGRMWASEYFVQPDMIVFGKKVQVCGFLCSRRIDEVSENVFAVPSRLNSTWG